MKELVNLLIDFKDRILQDGRSAEFSQLAKEEGFKFQKRQKFSEQSYQIKEFKIFKNKNGRRLKGIIYRELKAGRGTHRIYDFWTNNDMEESKTTIIELFNPKLNVSPFEIRPKRTIKWAKEILTRETKLFSEVESFHNFYEIKTENKTQIAYELNETFLDFISTKKRIRVEGMGEYLLVYRKNKQLPTNTIMAEYDFATHLLDLLLSKDFGEGYV